jgi:beta-aspartyl-dipeptidase (metallo-type)
MLTLIKGGYVYAPEKLGEKDILIGGSQILAIGEDIIPPAGIETDIVNATGMIVTPGYIDSHMHLLGGGGSLGPDSRSHEVDVSTLAKAGVTTVVGTLGIDTVSFSLKHLLMTANALDKRGISTLIYTGGYQLPAVTLMDSLLSDLSLINKVVGVKIALFDVLSSHPSKETIKELATKVWLGGRLGGKAGLIHAHLGDTDGNTKEIADMLVYMGLPASMLVTTHINRTKKVLDMSIEAGLAGASMDITALYTPDNFLPETIPPVKALRALLDAKIPLSSITMSSDGNASQPIKNENGEVERIMLTPANAVAIEIAKAVTRENMGLEEILPLVTTNAAKRLRIDDKKGNIEVGKDADILLLDQKIEVDTMYSKGKLMLKKKIPMEVGYYEKDYANISV